MHAHVNIMEHFYYDSFCRSCCSQLPDVQNWQKNLRALELPSAGKLPAQLLGMKCSTLALGVGGITIAVLSSMLYNSRQQNQCVCLAHRAEQCDFCCFEVHLGGKGGAGAFLNLAKS